VTIRSHPTQQTGAARRGALQKLRRHAVAALAAGALVGTGFQASAQSPEEFYKGKTIEFIIGYATGGSNDAYSRLIANHLGKHIPGNPTVVPKNMPGAGSFLAVSRIYSASPKDGTVIGLGSPTMAIDEKLGNPGVRFKTAELNWIGRVDSLINIIMTWKTSPVKTIADAQKTAATLSSTGAGSTSSVYPAVMNNVLDTKFKLILGYKGSNEAMLALERGEVEGHSTAWSAVKVAQPDWIRDKSINILVQFALKPHPELQGIPTAVELARNPEEREVLSAIMKASEIGTSFFTTPGVPADRLEALRRAFDATMKDPDFLADAKKLRLTVGPMTGEEVQKLVAEVTDLSPALTEKVREAFEMPGAK
jgi:tripartite-type tricarboxylate transporter receptor subunit TctC